MCFPQKCRVCNRVYLLWQSVLAMAGELRRGRAHTREASLLVEALTNANLPKLLASDVPLFSALVADLFPQQTRLQRVA
jgi:hypothetical protein